MILQLIKLLKHIIINLIDLSHDLVPSPWLVHQIRNVVPGESMVRSDENHQATQSHLEAMTRGNMLAVTAWPWNCWNPLAGELSQ